MKQNYFLLKLFVYCVCIVSLSKCKTPYEPPVQNAKQHFLVVEGFINGNGITTIKLSRTRNISPNDTAAYIFENGANVRIEDNHNNVYPLYSSGQGTYSGNFNLQPSYLFKLHITTGDNKEYLSDVVVFKPSPPIDSVSWKFDNTNSVQISISTHNPQNNTKYYRWDYEETWEFHSQYNSELWFDKTDTTFKTRYIPIYQCWRSEKSTAILLGSSAKLTEDIIDQAPLTLIPYQSKRISVLYSILVTQYALDSSGYNYWKAMESNTENVGSIFDPQPNLTAGNIHCLTDSSETVIGYIGAGSAQQSRIFISNKEMPSRWNPIPECGEWHVPMTLDSILYYFDGGGYTPIEYDDPPGSSVYGAAESCVDCTLTGTLIKPPFWP